MKNIFCKLGFHKFKKRTERIGWIDCGDHVMCMEESWIGCERNGCNKTKGIKNGKWITFKKENDENIDLNIQVNKGDDSNGKPSKKSD